MKIIKANTPPTEAGWYFVKKKESPEWEMLIEVIGYYPFLDIKIQVITLIENGTMYTDPSKNDYSEKLDLKV
jgi:hypothetical protein